jgi:hypothetical protein
MRTKPTQKIYRNLAVIVLFVFSVGLACEAAPIDSNLIPQAAEDINENRFQGVTYKREVRDDPRPMVIHILTIDLKANGIKLLVTPGDPNAEQSSSARTTSEFLEEFDLQIAINGDAFTPWHSLGPLGYYPHVGDPVEPTGYAASKGTVYSEDTHSEPTLYVYKNNKASIENVIGKVYNAVSGTKWLIKNGEALDDLGNSPQPRTAIALDRPGRRMVIIIVDGRQPGYSEGATLTEMAQLLLDNKGYVGFNLDGGGSSALVMADANGNPQVINSPIHQGIPGNERPVANHLGIYAKEK